MIPPILCRLGFHKYEYRNEKPPSLTLHRGCLRCGLAEHNRTGFYWVPWADGWTWEKAKQLNNFFVPVDLK